MTPRKHKAPVLRLVTSHEPRQGADKDSIAVLTRLLRQARIGDLHGFAYVAMYRNAAHEADTVGEATRRPIFTLGMLRALEEAVVRDVSK